jgi:hypothetical protein
MDNIFTALFALWLLIDVREIVTLRYYLYVFATDTAAITLNYYQKPSQPLANKPPKITVLRPSFLLLSFELATTHPSIRQLIQLEWLPPLPLCLSFLWVGSIKKVKQQVKVLIKHLAIFFLLPSKILLRVLPISFKIQPYETSQHRRNKD